ncbi:MAG: aminotransferase class V-fold PLP-dependent enzyme [Elusimicrobiaceae bacterium]|nr:aminotransferase class V-fold PLP-dependent enzyme [Elusimicrobiaceae bacterium]
MVILDKKSLPSSTFACGPAQSLPSQRHAHLCETHFERSHRAPDFTTNGLYKQATLELKKLFDLSDDYTVCFFPGGASPAMEAVLWNLTLDTLSGLAFGEFSNRWAQGIASRLTGVKHNVRFAPRGTVVPQEEPHYNASLLILTPNETSTGVQIPDEYLARVWEKRGPDTLVAWDTTSCAGGRNLPKNQFDVMLFGLQKCFGAMGGTCALFLSKKAVARLQQTARLRTIPYTLDLTYAVTNAAKFQTVNTPNTSAIWLGYQAAKWMNEHGGLRAMDALCRAHAKHLTNWAAQTDFVTPLVADEKFRSYTTLTLQLTAPHITAEAINHALADTGLENLKDGVKPHPYAPENSLRVACFPFVDTEGVAQYKKLTAALDEIVRQLRK